MREVVEGCGWMFSWDLRYCLDGEFDCGMTIKIEHPDCIAVLDRFFDSKC